ncbi:MAG: alpha/beta hydrolase [Ferruginibacter sp.]
MQEKIITYNNAAICYRICGKGKLVVLLHGFAENGDVWQRQIDFLQDNFLLIVPDMPGSGQSEFVENANMDTYAEIVKLIVDTELPEKFLDNNEEKVNIVGHSMGGYITLAFADRYPEYLSSFCLFHSSAFADSEEKKQVRLKAIDFIQANGSYAFLKTSTPALFTKAFAEKFPSLVDELVDEGKNITPEALIQYYRAMIDRPDRTEILKTFENPVLFLIGEHDIAVPLQASLQQCYLPTQSHVHILSNSAHMGMWEEPERSNTILLKFLQ